VKEDWEKRRSKKKGENYLKGGGVQRELKFRKTAFQRCLVCRQPETEKNRRQRRKRKRVKKKKSQNAGYAINEPEPPAAWSQGSLTVKVGVRVRERAVQQGGGGTRERLSR